VTMSARHTLSIACVAAASLHCSAVHSRYTMPGYSPTTGTAIKHVAVRAWSDAQHSALGPVLALVGYRLINQRKNYLLHSQASLQLGWAEACGQLQGVLLIRALDVQRQDKDTRLRLALELYRCSDGALLWRTTGSQSAENNDEDLSLLTEAYTGELGEQARPYVAAAFSLLQDLIEDLPNPPPLSDDEVEQRIELELEVGAIDSSSASERQALRSARLSSPVLAPN